jgi:hypothetical protein
LEHMGGWRECLTSVRPGNAVVAFFLLPFIFTDVLVQR